MVRTNKKRNNKTQRIYEFNGQIRGHVESVTKDSENRTEYGLSTIE
ncbi:hypothetical protein [Roseimaritima multifibrata]|nr:hypothetical protein [Roseimaritima multifibrata]